MKLYYSPGACSLADRISLHEGGFTADFERVDLRSKITEHGANFTAINPKGYVPVLILDDGETVTENIAILSWIASQAPALAPTGALAQTRLIEVLAFISTELHKSFKPFITPSATEADRTNAADTVYRQLQLIADRFVGPYLFGARFTVADAYLFVNLRWCKQLGVFVPPVLVEYFHRIGERPAVRAALIEEGLDQEPPIPSHIKSARPELAQSP